MLVVAERLTTVLDITGSGLLIAGVCLWLGLAAGLIVAGVLVLAASILLARGSR